MSLQLTPAQHADLEQHGNTPMPVIDPINHKTYVLVDNQFFERVKALVADGAFDIREMYAAQDAALAKVWDDPALDVYNEVHSSEPQP